MNEVRFQAELNEMWWDLADTEGLEEATESEFMRYAQEATAMISTFRVRRMIGGTILVFAFLSVPLAIVLLIVGLS